MDLCSSFFTKPVHDVIKLFDGFGSEVCFGCATGVLMISV